MAAVGGVVSALPLQAPVAAPANAATTPAAPLVDLGSFSRAAGPWTIDWARAQRDAMALVGQIDFSKPDIVIWAPGTSNHTVLPAFEQAIKQAYGPDASIAYLVYEASWNMRRSLPTGLATLLLALEEIKKRLKPGQRVFLGGESQGAWIVGEAMANPIANFVTRAAITGHPWVAQHHFDDWHDPRVQELNHAGDQITLPVNGDIGAGIDAMSAIHLLQLGKIGTVAKVIAANPYQGWLILKGFLLSLPGLQKFDKKPHDYEYEMGNIAAFLHDATRSPNLKPPLGATQRAQYEESQASSA